MRHRGPAALAPWRSSAQARHLGRRARLVDEDELSGSRSSWSSNPSLLATSDVLGTGWYAADAARVRPDSTVVVVVGDGAVGLMAVLAAKQMEAGRIIAMSRHKTRQYLALAFGATDIVSERDDVGIAKIKEMTATVGAYAVLECVGTKESMARALGCARPCSMIGYVGVPHGVESTDSSCSFRRKA